MYAVQPVVDFQWMVGRTWSGVTSRDVTTRANGIGTITGVRLSRLVPQRFHELDELALVDPCERRVLRVEVGLDLAVELVDSQRLGSGYGHDVVR